MKDESSGEIIREVVGLRLKKCSYKKHNDKEEKGL